MQLPFPLFLLLLSLILLSCEPVFPAPDALPPGARVFKGKVVHISDGDTFDVLVGREKIRIRLEGIDCPERGQPFGRRAKEAVSELVFGQTVRVVETDKDRNRRSIARVYLANGLCVNDALVRQGMAWHFTRYSDDPKLSRLQARARRARTGLWADKRPIAPWEWRKGER